MNKKVLYIGHYREQTGWSQAAIDYILALDTVGVDVVPRCIKLNQKNPELPSRILELEQKSSKGCDTVIQHVLPHYMDYNAAFKNVGLYVTETDSIKYSGWPTRLKLMDEIWVPNSEMCTITRNAGITKPVKVIPHACQLDKFKPYKPLDIPPLKNKFVFYFIGEFSRRKHLSAMIMAFHLAFDKNKDVALVIKCNKPNKSAHETYQELSQTIDIIKRDLALYPNLNNYHGEVIITNHMTDEDIMRLHATCNCFVMPSYGEAWNIPAFNALGMGNQIIASNVGGMADYLQFNGTYLCEGQMEPVFGADRLFGDLLTGRENWFRVNILDMVKHMRTAYFNRDKTFTRNLSQYSYKSIGRLMYDGIYDTTQGNGRLD